MSMYIFAIGGSGSRVLRSLTMLLASGVQVQSDIVPMIIDPDTMNGDLQRTVSEMRLYNKIRNQLKFDGSTQNKFFSANISYFNKDGNFVLALDGTSGIPFDDYIQLGAMSPENQAMMRMLFSNDNLASSMDVGFKGNPNIGSVVLNQFTQSTLFQNFENQFVAGDKVFIISSIFGGTGASGFPLLLKSMRACTNNALQNAYIGAVTLLPYFNLNNDDNSKIQADSFITKMKAALSYYERNVTGNGTLDEMYYLGDALSSKTYNNHDGGQQQENDAHVIELLAALSIIDFDYKALPVQGATRNTQFHEYGLQTAGTTGSLVFSDFGNDTNSKIRKPLSQMAIMNSYLNNRDQAHRTAQRWAKDRDGILGDSFCRSEFFSDYNTFKVGIGRSGFEQWLSQMANNQKAFNPFANDETLKDGKNGLEKVIGHKPDYGFLSKKGYDFMDEKLSKIFKSIPANLNAPSCFMELFYRTTEDICTNNLHIES